MKYLNRTVVTLAVALGLLSTSVSFAAGAKVLKFGKNQKGSALMTIYKSKAEAEPRCPCDRFSVIINEGILPDSATAIGEVLVITRDISSGDPAKTQMLSLRSWNRMRGSPDYTDQVVIERQVTNGHDVAHQEVTVLALKKKCLNPRSRSCKEVEIATQGVFMTSDISDFPALSLNEALEE